MGACAKGLPLVNFALRPGLPLLGILRTSSRLLLLTFLIAGMLGYEFVVSRGVHSVLAGKASSAGKIGTVTAARLTRRPDAEGFPPRAAWETAGAIQFDQDWRGKNSDPLRKTEVRLLWTKDVLYLRFLSHYRSITVFADAEPNGRRDQLWNRDVAEVFLQPAESDARHYKEFEVSPNGFWIDLDIAPGGKRDLQSELRRRVKVDEKSKTWIAELALPMKCLTARFDPATAWRVNFFRVEGASEPRSYSAWQPTGTPTPNFHVPECFGKLRFEN